MKIVFINLVKLFLVFSLFNSVACSKGSFDSIAQSHIDGNTPAQEDFRNFLIRDLQAYFKEILKKKVRVDYELLRDAPTQSGVAYPKYYAWVKVFDGEKLVSEGVVRIAAIEKKNFEITHYVSKEVIKKDPNTIASIFPQALVDDIQKKAGL